MARKFRKALSIAIAAAALSLLAAAAATPASAEVKWKANILNGPTNMVPGERAGILVHPGNTGDSFPSTLPEVTLELPPQLSFVQGGAPFIWSCTGTATVS